MTWSAICLSCTGRRQECQRKSAGSLSGFPSVGAIHTKEGMSIRAVIFDFGNVVGFFDHSKATRRLKHYSRLPEEAIYQFLYNGSLEDDFEAGRIGVADFLRALSEGCGMTGDDTEWGAAYADIFTPNPEVCALIPRLKARYRLVLGSNCTPLHSGRFREQFADTLRHFDGLVLSHEVGARKPHPAFYEACVQIG